MPLTGDAAGLRRLRGAVEKLATKEPVLLAVKQEVNLLLRDEFTKSYGPDGEQWQQTVKGRPAMVSRKLPFAFRSRIDRGELRFVGKTKRDMMTALHEGHVFPARTASASVLRFNSKNKLISSAAFRRALDKRISGKNPNRMRRYSIRKVEPHRVGQRVLPPRPIIPEPGTVPPRWQAAIDAGLVRAVGSWAERAQR